MKNFCCIDVTVSLSINHPPFWEYIHYVFYNFLTRSVNKTNWFSASAKEECRVIWMLAKSAPKLICFHLANILCRDIVSWCCFFCWSKCAWRIWWWNFVEFAWVFYCGICVKCVCLMFEYCDIVYLKCYTKMSNVVLIILSHPLYLLY